MDTDASTSTPRAIFLLAPGRSGSTLLQSAFLASCNVLTFFEPCRHGPDGSALFQQNCIPQVLRFAQCHLPEQRGRWSPPALRGWLRHPYVEANTSCAAPAPFGTVMETRDACNAASAVLVKEIRLVGQLERLASVVERHLRPGAAAIVHLVRDPRPMLLSQRRLGWWNFANLTRHQRIIEMERVAKHTCTGMAADAKAGRRLQKTGRVRYIPVRFEELSSNLAATTERLYAALNLPLPLSTRDWLSRTLRGQCAHGDASTANGTSDRQRFEYSTCRARPRRKRWKHELPTGEKRVINFRCEAALRAFGYPRRARKARESSVS